MDSVKILYLETSPADAERIATALAAAGLTTQIRRVQTRAEFLEALATERYDVLLADQANGSNERQALEVARAELERVGRLKDEFLATLSHELRTPLNAIVGWSTLLLQSPMGPEEQREGLEVIERNARVQTKIINSLLDMNRILSGKMRLDLQPADVAAEITAACETLLPDAAAKDLVLDTRLEPGVPPARVDAERLRQLVRNLVANAIKSTPRGGRIEVRLKRAGANIEIDVSDSGHGIPPEFAAVVFDRAGQGDAAGDPLGGLSLDLAIAKHLVDMHGGSIRVESTGKAGQGSTFSVRLPAGDAL
jgi:signal transduction histidine kinase